MLDIQFIRDNADEVQTKSQQKGYKINVQALLQADKERRSLLSSVEALRQKRNENTDTIKQAGGKPSDELIHQGKLIKMELAQAEAQLEGVETHYLELLKAVPNMPLPDVPVGSSEEENVVAKTLGEPPKFDFEPKQHWELAEPRGLIDKERAAKISGSRFAYIKGDLVRLQFAIVQFVMQTLGDEKVLEQLIKENNLDLSAKPFTPVLPPAMLRTEPYVASARLNAEEVTYKIEQDDLWLNASAEPLVEFGIEFAQVLLYGANVSISLSYCCAGLEAGNSDKSMRAAIIDNQRIPLAHRGTHVNGAAEIER